VTIFLNETAASGCGSRSSKLPYLKFCGTYSCKKSTENRLCNSCGVGVMVAVRCSVLKSVLQCIAVYCNVLSRWRVAMNTKSLRVLALHAYGSVLQCVSQNSVLHFQVFATLLRCVFNTHTLCSCSPTREGRKTPDVLCQHVIGLSWKHRTAVTVAWES